MSVYQTALDLLRQSQVHPEIAAQVLAYLFFFSSTLLFNLLLDKGEGLGGGASHACREHARPAEPCRGPGVLIRGGRLVLWERQGEAEESRRGYRAWPHRSRSFCRCLQRGSWKKRGAVARTGPFRPFLLPFTPTQPL